MSKYSFLSDRVKGRESKAVGRFGDKITQEGSRKQVRNNVPFNLVSSFSIHCNGPRDLLSVVSYTAKSN